MEAQKNSRRKRLLVDPKFQALFALYAALTTLVLAPLFVAIDLYFFNLFEAKARAIGIPPESELFSFVGHQRLLIVFVFVIATIIAILFSVFISFVISSRMAGSAYALRMAMSQAEDFSKAKKINARKFDFFQDLVEAYNRLVDRSNS